MMNRYKSQRLSWDEMVLTLVLNPTPPATDANEEMNEAQLGSQQRSMLYAALYEALNQQKVWGCSPDLPASSEKTEGAQHVVRGTEFSAELGQSPLDGAPWPKLSADEVTKILNINFQCGGNGLADCSWEDRCLRVDKKQLEFSISDYLASAVRPPVVDRVFIVALFDIEVTPFLRDVSKGRTSISQSAIGSRPSPKMEDWLSERKWAKTRLAAVLFSIGVLGYLDWISLFFCVFFVLCSLTLYGLGWVLSFAGYSAACRRWAAEQQFLFMLPTKMTAFYSELHGSRPLNVRYLRERAQELAQEGANWSKALWDLLDDIEFRGISELA